MFRKKSTKELVKGGSPAETPPEPSGAKTKKRKAQPSENTGSRLAFFRTRSFYGLVSIALGLLLALIGIPALQSSVTEMVEVVCFSAPAKAGSQITRDMLTTVELSAYHLPSGTVSDMEPLLGQYLLVDAVAGDFVTGARLSAQYPGNDPALLGLPEGKMALSISLPNLAQSVSGKLRSGDVIRIFSVTDSGSGSVAAAPAELRYVEVLSAAYADGADVSDGDAGDGSGNAGGSEALAAVTLLVNEQQALCLAGLEQNAVLHTALIVRGNDVRKANVLAIQEEVFAAQEDTAAGSPAAADTDMQPDMPASEEGA